MVSLLCGRTYYTDTYTCMINYIDQATRLVIIIERIKLNKRSNNFCYDLIFLFMIAIVSN